MEPISSNFSFSPTAAAAAAKSLQSCPTLCDPIDGSPPPNFLGLKITKVEKFNKCLLD